jgi:hypothetical protein
VWVTNEITVRLVLVERRDWRSCPVAGGSVAEFWWIIP